MMGKFLLALGVGVGALWLLSGRLTFKTYEAGNGTWTFAIYKGGKLLYTDPGPYENQGAAATAAANYIAQQIKDGGA